MYSKRAGTSGISGQLYESKLISLLYFRASLADTIEEFQLASNIDNIGAFDDICFKAKIKGLDKPVAVFIQAKHKENEKRTLKHDLTVYFDSYLKIRKAFKTSNKDDFFRGTFEKTECLFVIYTTATDNFSDEPVECSFASHLQELIGTGGTVKQPYRHVHDLEFLRKTVIKDQITKLSERVAEFISKSDKNSVNKDNLQNILQDELVQCYHVILAQRVFDVSEIVPLQIESKLCKGKVVKKEFPPHRIATFRHEFFDFNDEYLTLFKDIFFKEILKERKIKSADMKTFLSEFLSEPTDITKLSKLIGTVLTYYNGQLEYLKEKASIKDIRPPLNQFQIPPTTVTKAVELAAKEMLLSRKFKVPVTFGNKDLTIRDAKIESKINDLASGIKNLLVKCDSSKLVTIDDSLEKGFLQLNGGIAGAIGNIFVLDDNTKQMKITENKETLGDLAKKLYEKLNNEIPNLHEYKFCFEVNTFPKLLFDCSKHEENLARDFLDKLLFYSKQADENHVEEILKDKIEEYQLDHPNYFQAKTDAMFLKYHDEIQKWWMQPKLVSYLTKDSDVFENAINNIIKDPLMSSINITYMSKIKHFVDYTFTEDAVRSWNLPDHSSSVVFTENSVLTVVKVMQHLNNKDHVVLDFEYIVNLPTNDRNALRKELMNTSGDKVVVFVCDKINKSRNEIKTLENIAKVVLNKKKIVITNSVSFEILQNYFPSVDSTVHDRKNSLIDMSVESQKKIMETTRVMFQGVEVRLDLIVDDKSKAYVKGDILNKIISNGRIQLGNQIVTRDYDEIKHLYVDRWVLKTGTVTDKPLEKSPLKSLYDIEDDVVLVIAEPGMGKSTLLTHLSLNTKKDHPELWIVRINLLEYSRELKKWKEYKTAVDLLDTLKFLCQVILCEKLGKENNVKIALEVQNGVMYLKDCTGDQLIEFELNLFLHFFNEGKMILLFDGFDEICPHYMNEAIKFIKAVNNHPSKHKIWVTSRSYTKIISILRKAFGVPYEIEHLSYETKNHYLNKIWKSNLTLEELDRTQLENVHGFLEFMSNPENRKLRLFELPLHEIYINAGCYLINEIKDSCNSVWTFDKQNDDTYYKLEKELIFENSVYEENSDKNPLHLFLRAHFFITHKKDVSKNTNNNWNRDLLYYYQQYLDTKLKKIRFEDKNKMDISNPDIIIVSDKEHADFIAKHKKIAAYAIFNQDFDKLFNKKDLEEIMKTIKFIEEGGEKTGLIYSVANIEGTEIPIFIHMTFAEYFAVDYVCDLLKNENDSENQIIWMDFIFNVMFSAPNFANIRNIFEYRMKIDKTLMSIIESNEELVFNLLMEQGIVYSEYLGNVRHHNKRRTNKEEHRKKKENVCYWPPFEAALENLNNFVSLFASIFERYINDSNFDEFLEIVNGTRLLPNALKNECDQLVVSVFDIVKKFDISKLNSVLRQNFCYLSRSRIYDELCAKAIICLIREDYLNEYNTLKKNGASSQSYAWLFQ